MSFIPSIKKTGNKINLYKLDSEVLNKQIKESDLFTQGFNIGFLDLETTGFNLEHDKIIEIAIKVVKVNKKDGHILSFLSKYESFQDPGVHIEKKITQITGITNEMVLDQKIDWNQVKEIVNQADILLAHNAQFDRSFMDQYFPLSRDKVWACSIGDVDWPSFGFVKSSLELLSIWHGFYYESHRAMNDVDALIHLLTHPSYKINNPLVSIIQNSEIPYYKVIASNSRFETKDILKANNFRWDNNKKYWWKRIQKSDIESETAWLTKNVYKGFFQGTVEEVGLHDKYKQ
jgi:DNA polymerase-3 subunit epsilon